MVTRYTWSDSQINHIDFAKNLSGNSEATIFVSESTPAAALAELRETFNQQHIPTYLDVVGGKTVLKASGFSYPSAVLEAINGSSLVQGDSQMEEMAEDGKKQGLLQKIRARGTNIAGILGMGGHAALIASGAIAHERSRVMAGLQYGTSAGILALYGSGHEEKISQLCASLHDHLAHEGIDVAPPSALTPVEAYRQRGLLQRGHDAFKANSILAANVIGVGGNISMIQSGIEVGKRDGIVMGLGRGMHGAVNLAGAGVASFVDEKDPERRAYDAEKKRKENAPGFGELLSAGKPLQAAGALGGLAKDLISRAPLALQGSIFLLDNLSSMGDAYNIRKRYKQRLNTAPVELPLRPANAIDGSKEYDAWQKEVTKALHGAGHGQRLEMNLGHITAELQKHDPAHTILNELKISHEGLLNANVCREAIQFIEKTGKASGSLGQLLSERRVLLQEMEEVSKYPRGWILAAAKAGLWTASSAFQAIASKSNGASPEQKYSELFANVATMALDVPEEQRAAMVKKSAEFLSSHDFVLIKSADVEAGILAKLSALTQSPWAKAFTIRKEPAPTTEISPAVITAKSAAQPDTQVSTMQHHMSGPLMTEPTMAAQPAV